jgi:hypothetical protein
MEDAAVVMLSVVRAHVVWATSNLTVSLLENICVRLHML